MNTVIENILSRRSIRKFKTDMPTDADLNAIIEAGLYAPSTKGRQTSHILMVKGLEKVKELNLLVKKATAEAPDQVYKERVLNPSYTINYDNAPVFIIVTADTQGHCNTDADGAVILQTMFLAAHALGLGTVWINQLLHLSDAPSLRAFLSQNGVPASYRIVGCAALGYGAAELPNAAARKENRVSIYE